ncbi:MAG: UDP-N-acetylglucosamine--N-acetylmuramyl-(pentapeptide) pyrophosphoryl-undecaprenol N-acetylglucosamine transferase [Spirochaetota bacterium]|nr:UDP-N-acetylglucosamine--N-acetylmuramyl-(pentapeptide) pyrophosphoryl-undecaprenol N-acetylglucosamine transferase [Spirochaetota bacterium]
MSDISVLIVGGGTGGHISPGIAIYEEFKGKGLKASILVGRRDMMYPPISNVMKKDLFFYRAPSFPKKNLFIYPLFMINFILAIIKSIGIMKKLRINSVIGMGGYVSAPALVASRLLKIPIFLCEQNSIPGRITTIFARYATKIFSTFDTIKVHLMMEERDNVLNVGNPIRRDVLSSLKIDKQDAKKYFSMQHCNKVVFVIGGSQGAMRLNELVLGMKRKYPDEFRDIGIIWSTGEYSYKKYKTALHDELERGSTYISPFIQDVGLAYRASDIVISRAGSGVMVEFASFSLPSILIPYPYAASNHQESNAEVFERAGAAIKIRDEDALPDSVAPILTELLSNSIKLNRMSEISKAVVKADASLNIVKNVVRELTS